MHLFHKVLDLKSVGFVASILIVSQAEAENNYTFTALDVPTSYHTFPAGINNSGQVVGSYSDAALNTNGFTYNGGKFTTLDYPGATCNGASAVNNSRNVVGNFCDASFRHHGYVATTTCAVTEVASYKQFNYSTTPYDHSYQTPDSYNSPLTAPVSPNGKLSLADGTNSCNISLLPLSTSGVLGVFANNLSGLHNSINSFCIGMHAGQPVQDAKGWYLSVYDARCISESVLDYPAGQMPAICYPRSENTLQLSNLIGGILASKKISGPGCAVTALAMALADTQVVDPEAPPSNINPVGLNDFHV